MRVPTVTTKIAAASAALLLAGVGLTGCAESQAAAGASSNTIRYQGYQGSVNLPELAAALGDLDGVRLKYVGTVQGGPQSIQALVSNQVDYGAAFNGAIAQIASTGAPITSVISYYGSSDSVQAGILVKADGGVTSAKDLIGKKVAVNTLGANAEAVLDTFLAKGGLTQDQIKKVTLVPLPGINEEAALREGKVDAAYLGGALQESALSRPGLKVLTTDVDLVGPYNGGSIVLRDQFIKQNPALTKKFVAGMAKALVYTETHSADEVRAKLQAWLTAQGRPDDAKALALWKGTGIATHAGLIRDKDFDLWLDWLKSRGDVKADSIKASDIYTNKFNPSAEEG
jgi:ABC-type nitrate/sulfonate/bicarbonate transport system substrate-binding protein